MFTLFLRSRKPNVHNINKTNIVLVTKPCGVLANEFSSGNATMLSLYIVELRVTVKDIKTLDVGTKNVYGEFMLPATMELNWAFT